MTVEELHIGIEQELQDTGLYVNEDYQRDEVDLVINQEIKNMINKALPKDILQGVTLDAFTESNEMLQNVVVLESKLTVSNLEVLLPDGSTIKDADTGQILPKYSFLLSAVCSGEWCGSSHTAPLRIASNARFRNMVNHAYLKSKTYSILAQHAQNKVKLQTPTDDDSFIMNRVILDYIKEPTKVNYTSNKTLEYTDIPAPFHDELIRNCVRRIRVRNTPSVEAQVLEQRINNN